MYISSGSGCCQPSPHPSLRQCADFIHFKSGSGLDHSSTQFSPTLLAAKERRTTTAVYLFQKQTLFLWIVGTYLQDWCLICWATSSGNVSSGVCDQVTFKPACSAIETSSKLEISDLKSRDIILFKERTTKVLIGLHGCAGWSVPLLFAYGIKHVFAWPGPVKSNRNTTESNIGKMHIHVW